MRKFILFGVDDEPDVQKFFMCIWAVLYAPQNLKHRYIDPYFILSLY